MPTRTIDVQCCITGGGPAGIMLGLLLARAGVEVMVLEKHADFLRDFRGDTIHPSTLEILNELGILDEFLSRPHQEVSRLKAQFGDESVTVADFSHLPVRCPFIVLMPQWHFLDFLAEQGRRYPAFRLMMRAEVADLIEDKGRIAGLRAETPDGTLDVRAPLVIGADGRHSVVRDRADLEVQTLGAPMDVLWFELPRAFSDPADTMGHFGAGHIFIMINRADYWQCGFVIPKGSAETVRAKGLPAFRVRIAELAPFAAGRVDELADWDSIKLLTVGVDRLRSWYRPGILCIGDAAHTMSPVGGVGINLAIQDAVAASNILAAPLRENRLTGTDLRAVQQRREWPTRFTQAAQVLIQNRVVNPALFGKGALKPPLFVRLMKPFPFLRRIPARLVGMGIRPEHVHTREAAWGLDGTVRQPLRDGA
jgi:2-polyprenyl-6-methoxyphenol hydroxylase-like FAD-dependent oxidoreductase